MIRVEGFNVMIGFLGSIEGIFVTVWFIGGIPEEQIVAASDLRDDPRDPFRILILPAHVEHDPEIETLGFVQPPGELRPVIAFAYVGDDV